MTRSPLFHYKLYAAFAAVIVAVGCVPVAAASPARQGSPTVAAKIGVELDGLGDGARARPFVDLAKTLRPWTTSTGQPAPADEHGWPAADAQTVLFDIRPFAAWQGPGHIDDPAKFMPDWSGLYHLSFHGLARLRVTEDPRCVVSNQRYDTTANTTWADISVPKGAGLLVIAFSETRRSPSAPAGSGITGLRVIRPGYAADTKEVFTREFLRSLQPFAVLRFMDWLETNHNPGYYGDTGHHALNWQDRKLPADATQQTDGKKYGVAWEYVVQLANQTGKDLWINIPVAATDDYVLNLARMLKHDLSPRQKVYIEDSNEVWNYGFPQYIYNKLAAIDEVKRGGSNLAADGNQDQEEWARRRHIRRVVEIGEVFRKVFGEKGSTGRIRPIYASWVIFPDVYFANEMAWVEKNFGPPKNYFYGIAGAAYYSAEKAPATASPQQVLDAMQQASVENRKFLDAIQKVADSYGLKHCQYEVGPDTGGGKAENVANRILAHRLPEMKQVVEEDARRWFSSGGDLYMYFSHCSSYSRYGCWGLSEDIVDLDTPKWRAIRALTGAKQ